MFMLFSFCHVRILPNTCLLTYIAFHWSLNMKLFLPSNNFWFVKGYIFFRGSTVFMYGSITNVLLHMAISQNWELELIKTMSVLIFRLRSSYIWCCQFLTLCKNTHYRDICQCHWLIWIDCRCLYGEYLMYIVNLLLIFAITYLNSAKLLNT